MRMPTSCRSNKIRYADHRPPTTDVPFHSLVVLVYWYSAMEVISAITKNLVFGWSDKAFEGPDKGYAVQEEAHANPERHYTFLENATLVEALRESSFQPSNMDKLSDDSMTKICRQLEFWYTEGGMKDDEDGMVKMAKHLVHQSTWYYDLINEETPSESIPKVPKVRYGKTELQMPIVTCGGMRFQCTWLPDFVPLLRPKRREILKSKPQENIKQCVRACLKVGINHFETARFYGTSEYQLVEALFELIQEGEIKREDFIFQTKIPPTSKKGFLKFWKQSWDNVGEKLGYIDLCSLHCVMRVNDDLFACLDILEEFKKEGKVKHIGFSTHAPAAKIMALINTERFEYVNIHCHYFGSYHAEGTPDTQGGHGNLACVQRALELDMGVFNISPFDKGGKLYRPSHDTVLTAGKDLTPMAFAALWMWKRAGIHTTSVGVARPSDLDEVMEAARLFGQKDQSAVDDLLKAAEHRLAARVEEKLGKEWAEKGLINVPDMLTESTDGVAVGHMLWLHNVLTAYGMYEFAKDRYTSMEGSPWNKKKSWEENEKKISAGNPGRAYDPDVDYSEALKDHYNPELAMKKMKEVHGWLNKDVTFTDEDLEKKGWKKGYNLTVWEEYPGEIDSTALKKILLQNITGGRLGMKGGHGISHRKSSSNLRSSLVGD